MTEYTPEEAAKWLCQGGPCKESGDRCKVLAENCCMCVYAGNLIVRQSAEVSRKDEEIKLLLAVSDAARDLHKSIVIDLHKHDGWMQFDFTADPVDLYWVHHLRIALQALYKAPVSGRESS